MAVLLYVLGSGAQSQTPVPSIYFIERGESYMAYETWMLSFAIDLEPYHTHLDLLETEVDYFMSSVVEVAQSYDQSTRSNDTQFKALHSDIDRLTIQEVNSCKLEIMGLRSNYHQLADPF